MHIRGAFALAIEDFKTLAKLFISIYHFSSLVITGFSSNTSLNKQGPTF